MRHFLNGMLFGFALMATTTVGCCTATTVGKMSQPTSVVEEPEPEVVESFVFDVKDVDKVIQKFYTEWVREFNNGKDDLVLVSVLEKVRVEFVEDVMMIKGGFYMNGKPFPPEGAPCSGLTKGIDHVRVWIRDAPYRISKTSLVHELVHVSIKVETGKTYDPDHLGDKYKGWTKKHTKFIKQLNKQLKKMSL